MADLDELSIGTRLYLRAYRWRTVAPVPLLQMQKPLARSRVAIVSTAGLVLPHQPPFDETVRGGDWSFRSIPDDTDARSLRLTHRSASFDHRPAELDPNIAFPLDRLHELVADGHVGEANHRHFSFMGSLTATSNLLARSAPEVARALSEDGVDVALLVPI